MENKPKKRGHMQKNLWHGANDSKRDHLVNWDICCKSKQDKRFKDK